MPTYNVPHPIQAVLTTRLPAPLFQMPYQCSSFHNLLLKLHSPPRIIVHETLCNPIYSVHDFIRRYLVDTRLQSSSASSKQICSKVAPTAKVEATTKPVTFMSSYHVPKHLHFSHDLDILYSSSMILHMLQVLMKILHYIAI